MKEPKFQVGDLIQFDATRLDFPRSMGAAYIFLGDFYYDPVSPYQGQSQTYYALWHIAREEVVPMWKPDVDSEKYHLLAAYRDAEG